MQNFFFFLNYMHHAEEIAILLRQWRLASSTEMLLTVLQKISAGIAVIYCCPQIVKGSFNTK